MDETLSPAAIGLQIELGMGIFGKRSRNSCRKSQWNISKYLLRIILYIDFAQTEKGMAK